MKKKRSFIFILAVSILISGFSLDYQKAKDFPVLKGPYLGQKPPGMIPEVFAPGIISTEKSELNSVFSPKGDEFFYAISTSTKEELKNGIYLYIIMYTKQINGVWIKPEIASFPGKYSAVDMSFSPDGNRIFFCSNRPTSWNKSPNRDIWYCERFTQGWSAPINPGVPLNSPGDEVYPTFTTDGSMYFSSSRENGKGRKDVYYAKFINDKYSKPVHLGDAINTKYNEGDAFVAPDESYLLVTCKGRPIDQGGDGIFISFKKKDGSWSKMRNIKSMTKISGGCPMVSPDGKYFFFTRKDDIYWVDAKILKSYK